MKCRLLATSIVLLSCVAIVRADIVDWNCAPDGDGVFTLNSPITWTEIPNVEYVMNVDASHNSWDYGHMIGWFQTDTALDPTIHIYNSIVNHTGFTWTDYHVNVTLSRDFTLTHADVTAPSGWSSAITAPVQVGNDWVGKIDFLAGTPVPNLGTLTFDYQFHFNGNTFYTFSQELLPTPEPGASLLLGCGLVGLYAMRGRFRSRTNRVNE